MRRIPRRRPSPALVIACIALAIALGGTSYAAVNLAPGSVGNKQLKRNAVTSLKVKDHSLFARDFKAGQLPRGARGLKGDKGDKGDGGAPGAAGRSALTPLQSGETVRGTIGTRENNLIAGDEIAATATLPIPATVALDDAHVTVDGNDESAGECPGTATNPTAAPGFVCIYPWFELNVEAASPDGVIWGDDAAAAEKWGFQVSITAAGAGSTALFANWAYTAP
jgi:hypothetical protein